jgi:hypothetical protein
MDDSRPARKTNGPAIYQIHRIARRAGAAAVVAVGVAVVSKRGGMYH